MDNIDATAVRYLIIGAAAVIIGNRVVRALEGSGKRAINSARAPKPIGPYSQSVAHGKTLFLSGQIGMDPLTGELADGVQAQARQALRNMSAVVAEAGLSMQSVVKCTVLLTSMGDFNAVNEVYAEFFDAPYPARAAFAVSELPKGALVEIEAVAGY